MRRKDRGDAQQLASAVDIDAPNPQPFLKWVGGKRQLLRELMKRVPTVLQGQTYFEPFVGGGALFFADGHHWRRAVLGDMNRDLINTYITVRDEFPLLLLELRAWEEQYRRDGEKFYYKARDLFNGRITLGSIERAACFIGLNRTCFNGLYRTNKKGAFNVPAGKYKNPTICDNANLRACSIALQGVELAVADFETTCARAKKGDFVYFDPPYMPVSKTSDFTSYTADGFTYDDQRRLAAFAWLLRSRGVYVMLSNSIAAKPLYDTYGFKVDVVSATRRVNSKASKRGAVEEIIVT